MWLAHPKKVPVQIVFDPKNATTGPSGVHKARDRLATPSSFHLPLGYQKFLAGGHKVLFFACFEVDRAT